VENPLTEQAIWEGLAPIVANTEPRARLDSLLSQLGNEVAIDGLLKALADAEVDMATRSYKIGFLHGAEVAVLPKGWGKRVLS
jgi:hypothetical protein